MSILIIAGVLVGGIALLFAYLFAAMSANSDYRLGQASPSAVRHSHENLAAVIVTVAVAATAVACALWAASEFFSPTGAESAEPTTPPTSAPAEAEK